MYHWTDDDHAPAEFATGDDLDRQADEIEAFRGAAWLTLWIAGISIAAVLGPLAVRLAGL